MTSTRTRLTTNKSSASSATAPATDQEANAGAAVAATAAASASRDHDAAGSARQDTHGIEPSRDSARQFFENGRYPYKDKISTSEYEKEKAQLQVELLKAQEWIRATGQKVVLIFEGRDAAGKGGTIKRMPLRNQQYLGAL